MLTHHCNALVHGDNVLHECVPGKDVKDRYHNRLVHYLVSLTKSRAEHKCQILPSAQTAVTCAYWTCNIQQMQLCSMALPPSCTVSVLILRSSCRQAQIQQPCRQAMPCDQASRPSAAATAILHDAFSSSKDYSEIATSCYRWPEQA